MSHRGMPRRDGYAGSQCGGQEFDPLPLHQKPTFFQLLITLAGKSKFFSCDTVVTSHLKFRRRLFTSEA
jgi:hypothetical protein